jgi:hypothetical protein
MLPHLLPGIAALTFILTAGRRPEARGESQSLSFPESRLMAALPAGKQPGILLRRYAAPETESLAPSETQPPAIVAGVSSAITNAVALKNVVSFQPAVNLSLSAKRRDFEGPPLGRLHTLPAVMWLPGWQMEVDHGLSHHFQRPGLTFDIAYIDIFETGGDPDKGGHGPAILFRYEFGKKKETRRLIR